MTRYTDLSGPLYPGMWSYNILSTLGDVPLPELEIQKIVQIRDQGYEAYRYGFGSITGTYIETGRHMLESGPLLSDLSPSDFIRPAVICHVPRKGPQELIHGDELASHCPPLRQGDALLIDCGWGQRWTAPDFVTAGPAFHYDCLPWLLAQPYAILGVDIPCIESARSRPDGSEATGGMLVPIFERGVLLLAPLVHLDQVEAPRGELIALPLNFQAVSGAPCRALFKED